MAPITSEFTNIRHRRQAFVATCSPDELLGQVIHTLCPRYDIDAPHLMALRQLLSSAIVAPRKPPTLKRTRPDRRIGEITSNCDAARRSPYGPNGPPISVNQSFYFHHEDADFERLLPQADPSHYVWRDEPDSQLHSGSEEISDSPGRSQSRDSPTEILSKERDMPSLTPTSVPLTSIKEDSVSQSTPETPRKGSTVNVQKSQCCSVPTITITTPRSTDRMVTREHENTILSPPLPAINSAVELPESQEPYELPRPYSVPAFYVPQYSDTQDTVNSTQPSEQFSPPDDFVHHTPPTQEETQQEVLSTSEPYSFYPRTIAIDTATNTPMPPSWLSSKPLPSSLLVRSPSLGKRSREKAETTYDAPLLKRSK